MRTMRSIFKEKNFNAFVEMMNNKVSSYVRIRELSIIAYYSKWDINNKIKSIIEEWLEHIEDEKTITARQCIKDIVIVAKNKPELKILFLKD